MIELLWMATKVLAMVTAWAVCVALWAVSIAIVLEYGKDFRKDHREYLRKRDEKEDG